MRPPAYPIYHVQLDKTLVVFAGRRAPKWLLNKKDTEIDDDEAQELANKFGPDFPTLLGLKRSKKNIRFTNQTIFDDDTIYALRCKIADVGKVDGTSLYMWCEYVTTWDFESILSQVFRGRAIASGSEVAAALTSLLKIDATEVEELEKKVLTLKEAVKYVEDMGLGSKKGYSALGVRFSRAGTHAYIPADPALMSESDFSMLEIARDEGILLESYGNVKRIYAISNLSSSLKALLNRNEAGLKRCADIMDNSKILTNALVKFKKSSFSTDLALQVVHLRVQCPNRLNLREIFSYFQPGPMFPFVRFTSVEGVVFKLNKIALANPELGLTVYLEKSWTRKDKALSAASSRASENVTVMIFVGKPGHIPYYATLTIIANGTFDVKLSFSVNDSISKEFLLECIDKVNNTIAFINTTIQADESEGLALVDKLVITTTEARPTTKIMRCSATLTFSSLTDSKVASLGKVESLIESELKGCFYVVPYVESTESSLNIGYRRVSGFDSEENMLVFVKKSQSRASKEKIIKYLMVMFGLDADEALRVITESAGSRPSFIFQSLRIKIGKDKTKGVFKVTLDDVTNLAYIDRIAGLLSGAFTVAGKDGDADYDTKPKPNKHDVDPDLDMILRGLNFDDDGDGDGHGDGDGDMEGKEGLGDDKDDDDLEADFEAFGDGDNENTTDFYDIQSNTYVFEADVPPPTETDPPPKKKKEKKESLMLNELYKADGNLFNPPKSNGGKVIDKDEKKNYSTRCQMTVADMPRQPVVVKPSEFVEIRKNNPGSIRNWIAYGSNDDKAKRNIYFCPEVWCPLSRVAMTGQQFEKAGGVCPRGEDAVKYYKSNYFNSSFMYVKLQDHPDTSAFHKCAPCCFKTFPGRDRKTGKLKNGYVFNDDKCPVEGMVNDDAPVKENTRGDKDRYIMKEDVVPLAPGRFGLLSPALANILGNKGAKSTGHIGKETNAFVRTGIPYKKQGFFECMARVLNNDTLKSSDDIIKAIAQKLTVDDFLTIQDGLLVKRFMSPEDGFIEAGIFREFYAWFFHADRTAYIEKFGLGYVRDAMWMTKGVYKPSIPFMDHVKREYVIYRAFKRFIDFINDNSRVKTHDSTLYLFMNSRLKWLNPSGTNVIIFETVNNEVRFVCYPHRDADDIIKIGKPFVMLMKNGNIYEPIYRVKVDGATVVSKFRFDVYEDANVAQIVSYMMTTCKREKGIIGTVSEADAQKEILTLKKAGVVIKRQIIDYDFHVVAVVDETDLLIPLRKPCPMLDNVKRTEFIDTFYVNMKLDENIKKHAKTLFTELGYEFERKGKAFIVKVPGFKAPFFVPIAKLPSETIMRVDDIDIFIRSHSSDPRKDAVDMTYAIDRLHIAARNELIHRIKSKKELLIELEFLRHPANPIPKQMKRKMLMDFMRDDIDVILHKTEVDGGNMADEGDVCAVRKRETCTNQCKLLVTLKKKKTERCSLAIPESIYDIVLSRVLDDLVNPYMKLRIAKINAHMPVIDTNIVMFTATDIVVGRLNRIIMHALDEDAVRLGIERFTEEMDIESFKATEAPTNPIDLKGEEKNVHAIFRSKLRDFSVVILDDYTPMSMYSLFSLISKRIGAAFIKPKALRNAVAMMTASEFVKNREKVFEELKDNRVFDAHFKKKEVDEIEEEDIMTWYAQKDAFPGKSDVAKMANVVGIELLLISRVNASNPDALRCMTRNGNGFYVMLQQMTHGNANGLKYDRFDVVVPRDGRKVILESTDFKDLAFRDSVTKKCSTYVGRAI